MPSPAHPLVIPGALPLVLVAPHGGRRDPVRRPWSAGGVRVNDLHTASLTAALAAATGAAALINESEDRNDVDLNRIGEAAARCRSTSTRSTATSSGARRSGSPRTCSPCWATCHRSLSG